MWSFFCPRNTFLLHHFILQELYIQQLQSELSQLRKRATALDGGEVEKISAQLDSGKNLNNSDAKYKLKSAAAKIVQLAKENQQLIESNNRLRAQLKNSGNFSIPCLVIFYIMRFFIVNMNKHEIFILQRKSIFQVNVILI